MGKKKFNFLKRGAVIEHKLKKKTGTIIDWGMVINLKRHFDGSQKRFLIPSAEPADSIRVRTNEGAIEIWPTEAVELLQTHF